MLKVESEKMYPVNITRRFIIEGDFLKGGEWSWIESGVIFSPVAFADDRALGVGLEESVMSYVWRISQT